ncbi:hypothetical protein BC828DRAFT_384714 [Blastocladiella britannica]|nr:hypothetical protein BC828DRAFT_384714 [Blastocladiella britannica]
MVQNARHNASIRTLTSVELCVLTRAALNEVCLQHPSAAQMLKQILESQRIAAFATASAAAAAKVRKLRPVQVRARASSRNIASIVGLAQRSSHNNNSTNGRGGSTTPLDGERALPAVVIGTISRGLSTILRMSGQRPKGAFTLDAKDHDDSLRRTDQTTDDEGAGGTLGAGWAKTVSSSIQNLAGGVKQAVIGSRTQLSSQ